MKRSLVVMLFLIIKDGFYDIDTLKEKYGDKTGHKILRDFDLVIANSGGSIALTALAENWSIDKALTLFDEKLTRETIFSKNSL